MPLSERDEGLACRVADGDEAALEELYRRYATTLSRFIQRHTDGRDVDDLLQETWLRVIRSSGRFDPARKFSTWLFQIAVNLCRDRHRRRRTFVEPGDHELRAVSDRVESRMDAQSLLSLLPEAQREVLILRFFHDMTEAEVAEVTGCPRGTVKSRMHHAIATLAAAVRHEKGQRS